MNFSADASISNIIYKYMQPFERAVATGKHTYKAYRNAANHGSLEYLVKYKTDRTKFNRTFTDAACGDQVEAMKLLLTFGVTEFDDAVSAAIKLSRFGAIKFLISFGKIEEKDFNPMLNSAARNNRIEIIQFLLHKNLNFSDAFINAAQHGYIDIMELLRAKVTVGALNFALDSAVVFDRTESIKWLITAGITEFSGALCYAKRREKQECVKLLENIPLKPDFNYTICKLFGCPIHKN